MKTQTDDLARCSRCGGEVPQEGSEAWDASDGECPGRVTERGSCGAFDDDLAFWLPDMGELTRIAVLTAIETSAAEDRSVSLGTAESGGDSYRARDLLAAARAADGYADDAEVDYGDGRAVDVWGEGWRLKIVIA